MNARRAGAPAVLLTLLAAPCQGGDGGMSSPRAPAPVALRDVAILDQPTTLVVPISATDGLFVGIPGRLFLQCPRNGILPTSLDGDGVVLQDVWNATTGNAHSLAYVGVVPLPKSDPSQTFAERLGRAVTSFVAGLPEKYARVDFRLVTDTRGIKLEKAPIKVDGKPVVAWRTSKYVTRPTGLVNKAEAVLQGEAVLFGAESADSLVYLIVDSKSRRITVDSLLDRLSFQRLFAPGAKPRLVPLNDVSNARDDRYPIRLGWFESPGGFAPTLEIERAKDELVYAEDRVDEKGVVTATYRIEHRDRGAGSTLSSEAELERSSRQMKDAGPAREVAIGVPGAHAVVIAWRPAGAAPTGSAAYANTAVIDVDDKLWIFTWTTFGDEARAKADTAAFETLLHGLQIAIR